VGLKSIFNATTNKTFARQQKENGGNYGSGLSVGKEMKASSGRGLWAGGLYNEGVDLANKNRSSENLSLTLRRGLNLSVDNFRGPLAAATCIKVSSSSMTAALARAVVRFLFQFTVALGRNNTSLSRAFTRAFV